MQTLDGRRRRAEGKSGKEDGPERDLGALEATGQILDLGRVQGRGYFLWKLIPQK